jgi:copper(I)-binding protein
MKIFRILGIMLLAISFLNPAFANEKDIMITDGWTRASVTKTSAAYMQIKNLQNKDIVLVSVSSDIASLVELHKTVIENNISQMVPIDRLVIPAHQNVILAPKGLHIMLIGLKKTLSDGEIVPITLHFENAPSITINTVVK